MSKDQKDNVLIPVETVEKIDYIATWISTTVTFWDLNKEWPTNLIQDSADIILELLKPFVNHG